MQHQSALRVMNFLIRNSLLTYFVVVGQLCALYYKTDILNVRYSLTNFTALGASLYALVRHRNKECSAVYTCHNRYAPSIFYNNFLRVE